MQFACIGKAAQEAGLDYRQRKGGTTRATRRGQPLAGANETHHPHYIDRPDEVERFVESISREPIVAIDTEGASYHRFVDRVYLIQLSTRQVTAVIDPLPIGEPAALGRMIESPEVEVVFHDADYDLRLLNQDYGWRIRNVFDTRIAAQLLGIKSFGLAALLQENFGVKLDKRHQRADWSMRPLTQEMLDYAAQDTMHLLELRDRFRDQLERKGRWSWASEEFAILENIQRGTDDPAGAFLRMKGARDLNRRELAVLRELVPWRDKVAGELDRATFRVVGNEQLLAVAQKQPRTRQDLLSIKGMPRGIAESRGRDILAAVERGLAVPEDELPRFPRAPRWDRDPDFDNRVNALKTARDRVAHDLELDPGVLCSRDRMESVARRNPAGIEELQALDTLRRWQVEVLGAAFLRALAPLRKKAGAKAAAGSAGTDSEAARPGAAAADPDEREAEASPYRD
jgi:ribonuclease D